LNSAPDPLPTGLGYIGYVLSGKVIPGAVFLFFAAFSVQLLLPDLAGAAARPTLYNISVVLNRLVSLAFAGGIALVYVLRRPARAADHRPGTFALAMYGSFVMLAMRPVGALTGLGASGRVLGVQVMASNLLVIAGVGFSTYALFHLRLNFSLSPEARGLTRSGPYRLVRHPVYTGEVISSLGLLIAFPSIFAGLVFVSFVACQAARTYFEEKLLSQHFPEYDQYRLTTRRLVPWLL
jgi:protein-S-isoprenylcysteine O-methyltransferase Ste14